MGGFSILIIHFFVMRLNENKYIFQLVMIFRSATKLADMMDSVNHIKKALAQKGRPIEEFFAEFEKKYGIE